MMLRNNKGMNVNEEEVILAMKQQLMQRISSTSNIHRQNQQISSVGLSNPSQKIKLQNILQGNDDILDQLAQEVKQDPLEWEKVLQCWDPNIENIPFD
eukprot:CAMPEP_0194189078 /NCGR_PEP_ID=MMETSP0154-20130528/57473_1 /TAXON_ID=1049557 /ORGANISM="Thalassiothrix antarctica, Strain L6-D1" /LENGTH=97 /DNA_ID=CAMNT_0038910001 /DNA_START=86 /DNA_END=379 /DNA_ORIENTATION=-